MKELGIVLFVFYCNAHNAWADRDEPQCFSRFDYEYKTLQRLIMAEQHQEELRKLIDRQAEELQTLNSAMTDTVVVTLCIYTNLKKDEALGQLKNTVLRLQESHVSSLYTRWGRTTCPENGTDLVYTGYAAGAYYKHKGGGANYICLPNEPLWGHYESAKQDSSGLVYGAEYQYGGRSRADFFKKDLHNEDVPCSVCRTSRGGTIMVPGRNACFPGWHLEYKGYLSSGYYDHQAPSEYVCMDDEPESLGRPGDTDGDLFYFVEARCGTLPCPPYVDGRELTCAVCSK